MTANHSGLRIEWMRSAQAALSRLREQRVLAALLLSLVLAWMNLAATGRWASVPGALHGWRLPYYALARFGKWDEVLALPKPDGALPTAAALWHFGRAVAFAEKHDLDAATAEKTAFAEAAAKVPPDAMMNLNSSRDLLSVAAAMVDAKLAAARGQTDLAVAAWRKAVSAEDTLAYDEPPAWYFPTRESLGGCLLRNGQAVDAEVVFREDLKRNPGNGRSLFGLAEALKAQKKEAEAAAVLEQFKKAWARADVPATLAGL